MTETADKTEKIREQATDLLEKEKDMLTMISGDRRLQYVVDEKQETFSIDPKALRVTVPLAFFTSGAYHREGLLFHLFQTLALYPDWQRSPDAYLNRGNAFSSDAQEMASYFLARVKKEGLEDDEAYIPQGVYWHMQEEIDDFLSGVDDWVSVLIVKLKAPLYQDRKVSEEIGQMLVLEDYFSLEDNPYAVHRSLAESLIIAEFFGLEGIENEEIRSSLSEMVFGQSRYNFLKEAVRRLILEEKGIGERDPMIHAFLFPVFKRIWKHDIDRMEFSRTRKEEEQETGENQRAKKKKSSGMNRQDKKKILSDLKEQKEERAGRQERILSGRPDLSGYGVTAEDRARFSHYESEVRNVRKEMKRYWQKLIGEASREINVRVENRPKGVLDVDALIRQWPEFTEAERQQNYKNLNIFAAYELQKVTKQLPRFLDISFVIDSSGSMKSGKLESARCALAAVLLSLQDFAGYLEENARLTHQKSEVRIEAWHFGTNCEKIMSFSDTGQKRTADTILAISRLDGSRGTTDDGQCLERILKEMTPEMIQEQLTGRRIRMIFEVTDGASSFPGAAKKAAEELKKTGARIQAIEIGSDGDAAARQSFQYIFGKDGLFLGNEIAKLPDALMAAVKREITGIFKK